MASYFSISFFAVILPAVVVAYALVPRRARWVVLLLAGYAFHLLLSKRLIVFVLLSTLSVYGIGRAMGSIFEARDNELAQTKRGKRDIKARYKKKARLMLVLGIVLNVGILFALKYLGFFGSIVNSFLGLFSLETHFGSLGIGAPMGISFYTLMAVSYLADVYRETTKADKHLGRVALYLTFFPQIMEGPLSRYNETATSLMAGNPLTRSNLYAGTLRILVGFAKKFVIADRLDKCVGMVFDGYASFDGGVILVAAVLYTLQLYCDFAGTIDVAIGMGQLFDVTLPENFKQPFFSKTTSEFWQRWHITLGQWFKDYIFYPVSFSKRCKAWSSAARKRFGRQVGPLLVSCIALFCVWFLNGLWHGAGTQYLAFGLYYFVLIAIGGFVDVFAQQRAAERGIDRDKGAYGVMRVARTLCFVFLGELIFRSASAGDAWAMIGRICGDFSLEGLTTGKLFSPSFEVQDFVLALIGIAIVLAFDVVTERKGSPLVALCGKGAPARWAVWIVLLFVIFVFGTFGYGYAPVDPMYAQF